MISGLNSCSAAWLGWMTAMLWQSAIVIAIVWAADLLLRRFAWPQFRYMLWLLVFVKLLLPPGFALPTSVTSSGFAVVQNFLHRNVAIAKPEHSPADKQTIQVKNKAIQTNLQPGAFRNATPSPSWQTSLMLVWLAGVMVLAFLLYLRLRQIRMDRAQDLPEWFPSVLQECADKLSIKRAPAAAITSALKCPAVFGIFKPVILIPHECLCLEKKQISNILIHELTHIKRGDLFSHAVQIALQILYWPNILLWLIRRPMHDLRELCCDASAAAILRENTPAYRQTLLDVARRLIAEPANPGLGLLGLFEQPHSIVARLKYLERPYGKQSLCKYISFFVAFVMFIYVLPMSPVRAGTANQEKPSPEIAKSQGSQEKPKFEIISIKRSAKGNLSDFDFLPGGRLKVINLPLWNIIARCYGIPRLRVVGVPSFLKDIDWDIEAMPEEGKYTLKNGRLDPDIGNLMVQSMLEDRFKLKVHQETRILPGYELIIAKGGPRLTPPKDLMIPPMPGGGFLSRTKDPTKHGPGLIMQGYLYLSTISLPDYAKSLANMLFLEGENKRFHVVDKTGLEGPFDIELKWTPGRGKTSIASQNQASNDPEITIFDAIQEQLGLKLTPAKLPTPVLVVDDAQMPNTN